MATHAQAHEAAFIIYGRLAGMLAHARTRRQETITREDVESVYRRLGELLGEDAEAYLETATLALEDSNGHH